MERESSKECSAFFLWRKGSFSSRNRPSRNSTLFSSRRSPWSVLKCNQSQRRFCWIFRYILHSMALMSFCRNSIEKPQRVQNAAARVVYRAPKFCHITLLLFELHSGFWLGLELYSRSLLLLSRLSIIWRRNTSQIW